MADAPTPSHAPSASPNTRPADTPTRPVALVLSAAMIVAFFAHIAAGMAAPGLMGAPVSWFFGASVHVLISLVLLTAITIASWIYVFTAPGEDA